METVSFDGPWALFRMYDAGNPVQLSSNSRQLTIAMSAVKGFFIVELNSTMKDYPLWSRALKQFSCPAISDREKDNHYVRSEKLTIGTEF